MCQIDEKIDDDDEHHGDKDDPEHNGQVAAAGRVIGLGAIPGILKTFSMITELEMATMNIRDTVVRLGPAALRKACFTTTLRSGRPPRLRSVRTKSCCMTSIIDPRTCRAMEAKEPRANAMTGSVMEQATCRENR